MNQNMMNNLIQRINYLKSTFQGDPNKKIQELLNSGKVTQEQYNQAVQQANQIRKTIGM